MGSQKDMQNDTRDNPEQRDNRKDKKFLSSFVPEVPKPSHEAIFMSVAKKAEKISIALYMITDLIPVHDPIRNKIRQGSIELIATTRQMSYAFSGDIYFIIARAIHTSWELVSYLEVAASVGFVSNMNSGVLRTVLIELIATLRDKQKRESFDNIDDLKIGESFSDQITLSKKLFSVQESSSYKGQSIKDKETKLEILKGNPEKQATVRREPQNKVALIGNSKGNRREKIIEMIREKGRVSIGDITTAFPDISSKTVQRELLALVTGGVLKKEGDKRWSTYSLSDAASG